MQPASNARRAAIAIVISFTACTGGTCNPNPPPTADLRFLQGANVLFEENTAIPVTLTAGALAPVPAQPLVTMHVDFITGGSLAIVPGTQLNGAPIEAHLFAEDLDELNGTLRQIQSEVSVWDEITSASEAPRDVIVPFPPNPSWNTSVRYSLPLFEEQFWPSATPAGDAANPNGQGSVKSARIYYPGLCSSFQLFQEVDSAGNAIGVFDQVMDGLWTQFSHKPGLNGSRRIFERTTTLLDDNLNVTTQSPKGSFVFGFEFHYDIPLFNDQSYIVNYEYLFDLTDGRVTVEPTENALLFFGNPTPFDNDPIGSMVGTMSGKYPDQTTDNSSIPVLLASTFMEKQGIALFGACDTSGDPFATGKANALNDLGLGETALGISPGSPSDVALQTSLKDSNNWRCNSAGSAQFILRAKRLNVYPDGIELVWFDSVASSDPMYAAYVVLVGVGLASNMCDRSPPNVSFKPLQPFTSGFEARPITTDARGILCVDGSGNPVTCP